MAENFLDVIANKEFAVAKHNGYDPDDVDSFLDDILAEMERREAETEKLQAKIAELTQALKAAQDAAAVAPTPVAAPVVAPAPVAKPASDKHAAESFELVLTKAKSAYEEIVAAADARAEEIVGKANDEAVAIRANAEEQIADLTEKLKALRSQTADYYASLKKIVDAQSASMDQIKKLL